MKIGKIQILSLYFMLLSFYSAAIPIGSKYLKFDWIGAVIMCLYAIVLLFRHKQLRLPVNYLFIFVGFLVLNGLLSQNRSGFNIGAYLSYLFQYVLALSVFVTIVSMRLNTQQACGLILLWAVVASIAGALAIIQKISGELLIDKVLFIPYYDKDMMSTKIVGGVLAPTAWFSEASWFCSWLVVPVNYMIFNLIHGNYIKHSWRMHLVILTSILAGLVLGYSLTAILAVAVAVAVMMYMSGKFTIPLMLLLSISLIAIYIYSDSEIISLQIRRFFELWNNIIDFKAGSRDYGTSTSFYERSIGFAAGFKAFLENPLFGHGIGQSQIPYHSGTLTVLSELGLVGAFLIYSLPFMAIVKLLKISKRRRGSEKLFALSLIVCLAGDYSSAVITHHAFHLQRWLLISIAFSWIFNLQRQKSQENYERRTRLPENSTS